MFAEILQRARRNARFLHHVGKMKVHAGVGKLDLRTAILIRPSLKVAISDPKSSIHIYDAISG
jgi:hypothetical protein